MQLHLCRWQPVSFATIQHLIHKAPLPQSNGCVYKVVASTQSWFSSDPYSGLWGFIRCVNGGDPLISWSGGGIKVAGGLGDLKYLPFPHLTRVLDLSKNIPGRSGGGIIVAGGL